MFHKAIDLKFKEGTELELTFRNGEVKSYDMAVLFPKYPQLSVLKNRELFLSGKLMGTSGIMWNDELDIEAETIYEDGITIRHVSAPINYRVADVMLAARTKAGITQSELAARTGIDQSDISKIERGLGNPSLAILNRLAQAMEMELDISLR